MMTRENLNYIADAIAYQYNQVASNEAEQDMILSVAESLADTFYGSNPRFNTVTDAIAYQYNQVASNEAEQDMVLSVAKSLADAMASFNPGFDRTRFIEAACPSDK